MGYINRLVAISLTALFLLLHSAYADNLDAAKLLDLDNSLKHHSGNIITIRQEFLTQAPTYEKNVRGFEYSNSVLSVISEINIESESLIENQSLLEKMKGKNDMSVANAQIIYGLKLFKGKCGLYLKKLNLNLNRINNNALIFEVKNARDDVVNVCDVINNWK